MENEIMVAQGNEIVADNGFIADLTQPRHTMFCSMKAETLEEKAVLFNAMNNPEKRIGDCINLVIKAKDIFCEVVQCVNRETGEINNCPRIVIVDTNGVGYQAVSLGVYSAVKKLLTVYGMPTWKDGIPLKVSQLTKGDRKILTLDIFVDTKKKK